MIFRSKQFVYQRVLKMVDVPIVFQTSSTSPVSSKSICAAFTSRSCTLGPVGIRVETMGKSWESRPWKTTIPISWLSSIEKWWNKMWNTDELWIGWWTSRMSSGLPGITEGCAEKSGDIVDICIQQSLEDESGYQPQNSPNELLTFHLRLLRVDPRYLGWNTQSPTTHIYAKFGSKTDRSLVISFKKSLNRTASLPKKSIELRSGPTGDELLHLRKSDQISMIPK